MKKEISFGIGGIVLGIALILIFGSVNNSGSLVSNRTGGMMNNLDAHFIEQMIPHHDGAIKMAEMALTKANHSEIKTLARAIIKDQNKEIVDMRSWYKSWFGKDVGRQNTFYMMGGGMMSGGGMHMGGEEDIEALENAVDFDKAFIEGMIPHHQLAIMMAQMLKSGTNRSEMLTLSNNIIESQSKEIEQMQDWYKSWYK